MSDEMIAMAIKGAVIGGGLMIIAYIFQFVVHLFRATTKAVKKVAKRQYISEEDATIRLQEEHLYDQVAKELYDNNQNPAAWAKAIEKSEGDMDKAKSFYIKFRVQSLKDEQIIRVQSIKDKQIVKELKEIKERDRSMQLEKETKPKNNSLLEAFEVIVWLIFFAIISFILMVLFR